MAISREQCDCDHDFYKSFKTCRKCGFQTDFDPIVDASKGQGSKSIIPAWNESDKQTTPTKTVEGEIEHYESMPPISSFATDEEYYFIKDLFNRLNHLSSNAKT